MSNEKVMNRWLVVVGAILIQLCLGAIYAWSVFTKQITVPLADGGIYGFTTKQAMGVFSAGLATFAVFTIIAGRLQLRYGPRPIAVLGGIVLGVGYILGGFIGRTFAAQLVCIGIVGGAGIGLGYVVPIAVGVKWFPDKKGMVAGLAVAGFGFGATLWVKLAGSWFGGLLNTTSLFGLPGVQSVFFIYGVVFAALVLIGSIVMVNPPAGWKPAGWEPPSAATAAAATGAHDFTSGEMLRTPQYYALLLMFIGSALAGLMVIGVIRLFGIDALQASGAKTDVMAAGITAGTAMAWYAILNGLGRIVWGTVSDKIGRKLALFLMCLFQGIIMLLFFKLGASVAGLIVGACIIGFNFGGNFALFPAATADFFGNKNVGINYGWVFLAYGVAGIAGPQVAGYFKDAAAGAGVGAWWMPFIIASCSCFVAAVIGIMLKAPKRRAS
jgi:OFA family oxalate/formate antiporter-like MFS transporter